MPFATTLEKLEKQVIVALESRSTLLLFPSLLFVALHFPFMIFPFFPLSSLSSPRFIFSFVCLHCVCGVCGVWCGVVRVVCLSVVCLRVVCLTVVCLTVACLSVVVVIVKDYLAGGFRWTLEPMDGRSSNIVFREWVSSSSCKWPNKSETMNTIFEGTDQL